MLSKILPEYIVNILTRELDFDRVYELRARVNAPIVVNYGGETKFLSRYGVSGLVNSALTCDKRLLDSIVYKACDYSVYAVNGQLKNAFITIEGGIRIGICGETVTDNGAVKTLKNFSSVNIRVPHAVKDCALRAFPILTKPQIFSTLVISPPGGGKTTFLRDYARLLSSFNERINNILILDERGEISAFSGGVPQFDLGWFCDVLTNCTKSFGFENGIRALKPDVIITDELMGADDLSAVARAASCGIKIVASVHAGGVSDLKSKPDFAETLAGGVFERYVVLSERSGAGTYEGIFDSSFKNLYYPSVGSERSGLLQRC